MISRQHVVEQFFEEAEAMRKALDACFKDPYTHKVSWDYFCDPRMYTYLRTSPEGVMPAPLFDRFTRRLRTWCIDNLGLVPVNSPNLHLMINGCRLGLHSDFHNGAWGYVYSLTRWESRKFSGGETLLLRDGIPSYKRHHVHGDSLYELVPAEFNQLLVFDDRIVHGTPTIEGSMDPLDGRIALVGHIRAMSPVVMGGISLGEARRVVLDALARIRDAVKRYKDVQGTITFRITVAAPGTVESVAVLTDNLVTPANGYERSEGVMSVKMVIQHAMMQLVFEPAAGKSVLVIPVLVPLPDLAPIELNVSHDADYDRLRDWVAANLLGVQGLKLNGSWEGDTFEVREPIAGSICLEEHRVVISFDPPMWVPSQRESFRATLTEAMKSVPRLARN